jgi:hypothetical protein
VEAEMVSAKILTLCASCLLLQWHGVAQIGDIQEHRVHVGDGVIQVEDRIENHSKNSIIAFIAAFECPTKGVGPSFNFDGAFDQYGVRAAIESGEQISFPLDEEKGRCRGGVTAALFSDGHAEGRPGAINEIFRRRIVALEELNNAEQMLQEVIDSGADPKMATDGIAERMKKVGSPGEDTVVYFARIGMVSIIQKALRDRPLPGAHQPDEEEFMKNGGVSQAVAHQLVVASQHFLLFPEANPPDEAEIMRNRGVSQPLAHLIVIAAQIKEWRVALDAGIKSRATDPALQSL